MRTARVYVWNAIKMAAVSEITLMLLLCSLMRNKSPQKTNISSFDRMKRSRKKTVVAGPQDGGNSAENSLRNVCEGSVGDHGCCRYCSRRTWRRRCRIHFSDEISLRTARSFVGQSAVQISTIFGQFLKRLRHTSERTVYMYMHSTGTYTIHIARAGVSVVTCIRTSYGQLLRLVPVKKQINNPDP